VVKDRADEGKAVATAFSHLGICVADLERSQRFYCEVLGFAPAESHEVGEEFGRLMELDGVRLRSRFLRRDGLAIELLCFASPSCVGAPARRPMNLLGLTHLSVRVDDVDAVAARVEECGGAMVSGTRTTLDFPGASAEFVYCTDPDGTRIELMRLPG